MGPMGINHAIAGFNVPDGPNFPHGMPGFSLHSTEPTQGNDSGLSWSSEGQQYLHQNSTGPHGTSHNGYPDSFISYQAAQEATHGNSIVRGSVSGSSRSQWNNEPSAAHLEAVEMTRFPSQDSTGAQSQRTTNSYDQGRSTRMYSAVSQMPYQMQSTDAVGRSHSPDGQSLYAATPLDMQTFDHIQYPGGNFAGAHPMYHRGSNASNASHPMSLTTGSSYNSYPIMGGESLVAAGPNIIVNQGPVPADSLTYHSGSIIESPTLWDNNGIEFLDSQRSSPTQLEDPWSLPLPQMATSATNSPFQHSPSIDGISPRVTRKPIGPRPSKVASDMAAASRRQHFQGNHPGTSEASDESFKFGGRSSLDLDNTARDHFLYQNVTPQADGLYHCPFEKEPGSNCQHKPEKLKCNYDKFVDSHLKPYTCKITACKDLHFSSTACLLRHEREAHAMHGHGDKPYLCTYDGCERGVPGNGFPRHWNLRDHMKRVHNDPGQGPSKSNASASPPPSSTMKSKKRKAGDSETILTDNKAAKRIATPPIVIAQPQEPSVLERYQEKHALLLDLVKQLHDPRQKDNMTLLRSAHDCIKVMVQTTSRINAAPDMGSNIVSQSG